MKRTFLPVGQGAFYLERFEEEVGEKINVIYDCGSSTDVKLVNDRIKQYLKKGETIDALIISHFDEDHINGIPFLLKYCHVEKIYFPIISSRNKVLMSIGFEIRGCDQFVTDFLDNPIIAIRNLQLEYEPQLIQIREYEYDSFNDYDIISISSGQNLMDDIINSRRLHNDSLISKWEYIPYNFRQSARIEKLFIELRDKFKRKININELENLWRYGSNNDRDEIKEAYKKVPGTLNTNSMTLFSGTTNPESFQYVNCWDGCFCTRCCQWCVDVCQKQMSGCLYMGDYDASGSQKWMNLKEAYKLYWNNIGCVQVPHHGSRHNFNKELLAIKCIYVISAGYSNKYRHPHAPVLKQFIFNHIIPYIVTEYDESELSISIIL